MTQFPWNYFVVILPLIATGEGRFLTPKSLAMGGFGFGACAFGVPLEC